MAIADQLLASFSRIAASDGGALSLVDESGSTITLAYRPGVQADCEDGVCALPQAELEAMMRAWLARKAPDMALTVKLLA
jgi:enoyl-[acyl-carrier-protein] reductase (NADH)